MSLIDLLLLLLIAGICGAIGMSIAGASRGGCMTSIALGFIGALVGMWLQRLLGLPEFIEVKLGDGQATAFPVIWSIIGAALFMALIALFTRRPPPA